MYKPIDSLPETSKIWIFPLSNELSATGEAELGESMTNFINTWKAHGHDVLGSFFVVERRVLVVAADDSHSHVSGCSIDSMFATVNEVVTALVTEVADSSMVVYRNGDSLEVVGRDKFQEQISEQAVSKDTLVFDNTISSLGAIRNKQWQKPLIDSWHSKAFDLA